MTWLPLSLLLSLYLVASLAWDLSQRVGAACLLMSLSCFLLAAIDGQLARTRGVRSSGLILLLLGLAGGWPGILLARRRWPDAAPRPGFSALVQLVSWTSLALFAVLAWGHGQA